jgi:hypothetical protein
VMARQIRHSAVREDADNVVVARGARASSAGERASLLRKTGASAASDSVLGFHRRRSRDGRGMMGSDCGLTFSIKKINLAVVKVVMWLILQG